MRSPPNIPHAEVLVLSLSKGEPRSTQNGFPVLRGDPDYVGLAPQDEGNLQRLGDPWP